MLTHTYLREISRQKIISQLAKKPSLIEKSFLVTSDILITVADNLDQLIESSKGDFNSQLFPKFVYMKSDPGTGADRMIMYIGPMHMAETTCISTTFFYYKSEELSVSFLFPKTKPNFKQVLFGWVIAGDSYIKRILFFKEEVTDIKFIYHKIREELSYFYNYFILKQPFDVPQRFIYDIKLFVNDYIIDRWFAPVDKSGKLHNDPRPEKPSYLNLYIESYSHHNLIKIKKLKEKVADLIEDLSFELNKQIKISTWAPGGTEYYKLKRSTLVGKK